jgi:hypothetical protein
MFAVIAIATTTKILPAQPWMLGTCAIGGIRSDA